MAEGANLNISARIRLRLNRLINLSTAPLTWGFRTMGCTEGTEGLVSKVEKRNVVCFIHQHAINTGFFKKIDFENGTLFDHMF